MNSSVTLSFLIPKVVKNRVVQDHSLEGHQGTVKINLQSDWHDHV